MRRVVLANRVGRIDANVDVQAVLDQQYTIWCILRPLIADKLRRIGQCRHQRAALNRISRYIRMRSCRQRCRLIQKRLGPCDNPRTPRRVIALATWQIAQRIGAIKRIIKASPPRIRGIQRKAGVGDRDNQLRTGHGRNLGVDIRSLDLERVTLWHQIANLAQERLIRHRIMRLPLAGNVPVIDLPLNLGPLGQKHSILGPQIMHQGGKTRPERIHRDTRTGQRLRLDECRQLRIDLQPVFI